MFELRRILSPVDFTETSYRAVEYAVGLASKVGAELHLVHAFEVPTCAVPGGAVLARTELLRDLREDLDLKMQALLARHADTGVAMEGHLVEGTAHEEISAAAEAHHADLIVIGAHGHAGMRHLLAGSVSDKVLRCASVPVLILRPYG